MDYSSSKNKWTLFTFLAGVFLWSACKGDFPNELGGSNADAGKSQTPFDPGKPSTGVFDFQKECGVNQDEIAKEDRIIFQQVMKSLPIVTIGSSFGTQFRVIAQATLNIVVYGGSKPAVQEVKVEVLSTESISNIPLINVLAPTIVKNQAIKAALEQSGIRTSAPLPNGDWVRLTSGKSPEFNDLLCAVTGGLSTDYRMGENGSITGKTTYSPTLIQSVSPFAPIERVQRELGNGRSFPVTVNVTGEATNIVPGTYTGRVNARMIEARYQTQGREIRGDWAVEFVNQFPDGAYKAGLSVRQVYMINSAKKNFAMIYIQSDYKDPSGIVTPDIIFVGD